MMKIQLIFLWIKKGIKKFQKFEKSSDKYVFSSGGITLVYLWLDLSGVHKLEKEGFWIYVYIYAFIGQDVQPNLPN